VSDLEVQKLDRKTKETARMMYFGDYEQIDICEKLNITNDTLRFYIFGDNGSGSNEHCWFQLKKQLNPVSVATYIKDKILVLDKTAGMAMNILNENLRRIQNNMLEDSSLTLSMDDTKKLAGIVLDMDKIVRLESGKATDIIDNIAHMSVADARRILAEDPFSPTVIEAEFEDIVIPDDTTIETSKEMKVVERPWK
jgi:hypothetical protein